MELAFADIPLVGGWHPRLYPRAFIDGEQLPLESSHVLILEMLVSEPEYKPTAILAAAAGTRAQDQARFVVTRVRRLRRVLEPYGFKIFCRRAYGDFPWVGYRLFPQPR